MLTLASATTTTTTTKRSPYVLFEWWKAGCRRPRITKQPALITYKRPFPGFPQYPLTKLHVQRIQNHDRSHRHADENFWAYKSSAEGTMHNKRTMVIVKGIFYYKILLLTFCLQGIAPGYLTELLETYTPAYPYCNSGIKWQESSAEGPRISSTTGWR